MLNQVYEKGCQDAVAWVEKVAGVDFKALASRAKEGTKKAFGKVKDFHAGAVEDIKDAVKGTTANVDKGAPVHAKQYAFARKEMTGKERLHSALKGAGKLAPAAVGTAALLGWRDNAMKRSKDETK